MPNNPPSRVYGDANNALDAQSPPFLNMHHGPWKFGGRFYDLVSTFDGTTPQIQMRMTNDPLAQPWVTLDQANGPTGIAGQPAGMVGCYSVANGSSVDVAYTYQDDTQLPTSIVGPILIKTFTFSPTGGTWGGSIAGGPQPIWTAFFNVRLLLTRLSNNDIVVAYGDAGASSDTWIALYNGAWQAPIAINDIDPGVTTSTVYQLLVDPSDRVAVMWRRGGITQVRYSQFTAGALGASVVAAAGSFSVQFNGVYLADDLSINFVIIGSDPSSFQFLKGTPSSNPAFTLVNTGIALSEGNAVLPQGALVDGLYVVAGADSTISRSTNLGGTWSAAAPYASNVLSGWTPYGYANGGLVTVRSATVFPGGIGPALITNTMFQGGGEFYFNPVALINPGPGGAKQQILTPNKFDYCLHREYRLFCNIDYDRLGCAKLPACFTVDERDWQTPP